ncbi:MAG: hypothetical protein OXF41_06580 [bacterium]|nr:hypothetical protein [bacterium]
MNVTEDRLDAKLNELRAAIEQRFNDQTQWISGQVWKLIVWMTALVLGAAGLVIGFS